MAFLVTGGTGFIGTKLATALKQEGINLYITDFNGMDLTDAYQVDRYFEDKEDIDAVIHLASDIHFKQRDSSFFNNLYGTHLLLDKAAKCGVSHFFYASTNNVYGPSTADLTEDSPLNPCSDNYYALTKYLNELDIINYAAQVGFKFCIARFSDVYGPAQSQGNLLNMYINNVNNNAPLQVYGQGVRTRDYIYIDDLIDGIVMLLKLRANGIYNISTGIGTSISTLAEIFAQIPKTELPIIYKPVESEDTSRIVLDCSKLRRLGFQPKISVREGMNKLYRASQ